MEKRTLQHYLIRPLTVAIVLILVINTGCIIAIRSAQAESEMREKAAAFTHQMKMVWDYIAEKQDVINYSSDGKYDYKKMHCALVGIDISNKISETSDYSISYVREFARGPHKADKIELAALAAFEADKNLADYSVYDTSAKEGFKKYFRYITPMYIEQSCLECHGEPQGATDISGYPKEGMKIGDLYGAASVSIPVAPYSQNMWSSIIFESLVFGLLVLLCALTIYVLVSRYVTKPLAVLADEIGQVQQGNFDISLSEVEVKGELADLTEHFTVMAGELKSLYSNLEAQVDQRTEQLAAANDSLKYLNQRLREDNQYKSEFLAIMSHELRTPLSSIMAFTEILLNSDTVMQQADRDVLQEIRFSGEALLALINNILEMAKIEAGQAKLTEDIIDWGDIRGYLNLTAAPLAVQKGLDLQVTVASGMPFMRGDCDKLWRMVQNLVGNAIKFTARGGKVQLDIHYEAARDAFIVTATDTGIGIEECDLPYIFDKFVQGDSSSKRQSGGTGLGLALVLNIAEMHGGTVSVSSKVGVGSIFTVILPSRSVNAANLAID